MTISPMSACFSKGYLTEMRVIPSWVKNEGLTRCFVYTGPSMKPTFCSGQLLYVRPTARDLAVGDVVVFVDPVKGYVVHRVVSITEAGITTRGDNNEFDDLSPVLPEQVIGRVEMTEDRDSFHSFSKGRCGLWSLRVRQWGYQVERGLRRVVGAPYRALYEYPLTHPLLLRIILHSVKIGRFATPDGPFLKYVCGKKVMARWSPGERFPQIERPYDLFLHPKDLVHQAIDRCLPSGPE